MLNFFDAKFREWIVLDFVLFMAEYKYGIICSQITGIKVIIRLLLHNWWQDLGLFIQDGNNPLIKYHAIWENNLLKVVVSN